MHGRRSARRVATSSIGGWTGPHPVRRSRERRRATRTAAARRRRRCRPRSRARPLLGGELPKLRCLPQCRAGGRRPARAEVIGPGAAQACSRRPWNASPCRRRPCSRSGSATPYAVAPSQTARLSQVARAPSASARETSVDLPDPARPGQQDDDAADLDDRHVQRGEPPLHREPQRRVVQQHLAASARGAWPGRSRAGADSWYDGRQRLVTRSPSSSIAHRWSNPEPPTLSSTTSPLSFAHAPRVIGSNPRVSERLAAVLDRQHHGWADRRSRVSARPCPPAAATIDRTTSSEPCDCDPLTRGVQQCADAHDSLPNRRLAGPWTMPSTGQRTAFSTSSRSSSRRSSTVPPTPPRRRRSSRPAE